MPKVSGQIPFPPIAQSYVTHRTTMQMIHKFWESQTTTKQQTVGNKIINIG